MSARTPITQNRSTLRSPKDVIRSEFYRQQEQRFSYISNPIDKELRDIERHRQHHYTAYPYIPFMGQGDAMLYFLQHLRMLSPTHSGIITSIRDFVLGGELEVIMKASKRPGFVRRAEQEIETNISQFNEYIDYLEAKGLTGTQLMQVLERAYDNYKTYGNAFIELVIARTDGQTGAQLHVHDMDQVRYYATLPGQQRMLMVSPKWTEEFLIRHAPQFVPLYPNFIEDEFGATRTMLHIKNVLTTYDWYGMPDWLGGLYFAYNELQLGEYSTAGYANDWIGKLLIEFEADADLQEGEETDSIDMPTSEDMTFVRQMERVFTNKGNGEKQSVLWRRRPIGADPTFVHEFKIETNEKFHQATTEIDEGQLFKAHNWHPSLMIAISGKLGTTNEIKELIQYKQETVVRRIQNKLMQGLNVLLDEVATFDNQPAMRGYGLRLSNVFIDMLKGEEDQGGPSTPVSGEDEGEDATGTPEEEEERANKLAQANLRGSVGGVRSILDIQLSVVNGITQYESGVTMLIEIFGYSDEKAREILGEQKQLEEQTPPAERNAADPNDTV